MPQLYCHTDLNSQEAGKPVTEAINHGHKPFTPTVMCSFG